MTVNSSADGTEFSEALDEAWLTDNIIADNICDIALNATKTMTIWSGQFAESIEVPDYKTRLSALKISMEAKWHLNKNKAPKNPLGKNPIFILVN
jgi:hypothetical protein